MYCKIQAVAWNARIAEFTALGYGVAEITYDPVEVLKRFSTREKIGYTLLADPGSEIIGAFDLIDSSLPPDSKGYGYAHPLIFVIDKSGVVRHRFSNTNYQVRPDVEMILDILCKEAKS